MVSESQAVASLASAENARTIERFLAHCHRKAYPPNALIIRAGEPSRELFCLVSGSVSVRVEQVEGHEMVLAYLYPGDFFGEIGMFDELHLRSAVVRSRTRCEVARISYEKLTEVLAEWPDLIFELLSQLAVRLRDTSRKAADLAFVDVSGRIAHALLELCRQPDAVREGMGIHIRVTRQELGRIAGCSRETVGRVFKDFEDRRLISFKGKSVVVYDRAFPAEYVKNIG